MEPTAYTSPTPLAAVAHLADMAIKHAIGVEDGNPGAAEELRDLLLEVLQREGTTIGLLDGFDLGPGPELRAARARRIEIDEQAFPLVEDRRHLAGRLVAVFAATAFYERRLRLLNAELAAPSTS